ncbi:hypothetical protein JTB14_018862 [Gonioctena quinquepunctata]|nr:hypothetical protein JTB14_018862 [Gonioctena quinquepunctata]
MESLILDSYEFKLENKTANKTSWRCVSSRTKQCKAKFVTFDDIVQIKDIIKHNHAPTFTGNLDECSVEIVEIRMDPSVKAIRQTNSIRNGDDSGSEKLKNIGRPTKKIGFGTKKNEPPIIVMGVESLMDSKIAFRRRDSDSTRKLDPRQAIRRSDSGLLKRADSPNVKREAGAKMKDTPKPFFKKARSALISPKNLKRRGFE